MLEKIGLPPKPSLRGNNWVVDATHCQGCSSQFTFINRKHHCRRCGGIFCGSCTQQRMYLRGQGDSPVRICEPCKSLEEAARFEMRYGHKNKTRKGASKITSDNEGDIGNDSFSSNKDSINSSPSIQQATSASSSTNEIEFDLESTTPEELKKQAIEEKNKYKILKSQGKPEEALKAFKRGKELERKAANLEIELRKNRKKTIPSSSVNESIKKPKESNDLVSELRELGWSDQDLHNADKKPVSLTLEGELSSLIKEVSQKDKKPETGKMVNNRSEVLAIKKNALALKREGKMTEAKEELKRAKILEKEIEDRELLGDDFDSDSDDEFSSLIRSMDIDKRDVLASGNNSKNLNVDFNLDFDRVNMDDVNFEVTDDDLNDPEMSAALQSLGWDEDHNMDDDNNNKNSNNNDKEMILMEIQSLKKEAINKKRNGNAAEALALLKKARLLEADIGGIQEISEKDDFVPEVKPKNKLAIQRELLAIKKKALALRREGNVDEADRELMKGKILEQQLEEIENGPKVKVKPEKVDFLTPMDVENEEEDVTDMDMNDPSYLSVLENLGWKDDDEPKVDEPKPQIVEKKKSKTEIQRELLALKRKSLALRREGKLDEAEEVLKTTQGLEVQLAELEGPKQETIIKEEVVIVEKKIQNVENDSISIEQQIMALKRKALSLKREGKLAEAKEALKQAKLLEKENAENTMDVHTEDKTPPPKTKAVNDVVVTEGKTVISPPVKLSSRERFKIQQESLSHKRNALKLRREGKTEEADAEFEIAKNLESQLEAATESTGPVGPVDDVAVEDLLDPQLLFALREVGIESGGSSQTEPVRAKPVVKTEPLVKVARTEPVKGGPVVNVARTELEEQIKAEKVNAVGLKRAGKQSEALDALRRAKLLEKKLSTLG